MNVILIKFHSSGFLSQILKSCKPYVIIIWFDLKMGRKVIIPRIIKIIENINKKKICLKNFFILIASLILILTLNLENYEKFLSQKMYKLNIK